MADKNSMAAARAAARLSNLNRGFRAWRDQHYPEPPPIVGSQRQVMIGSMFGDGHIGCRPDLRHPFYTETHGAAQESYVRWKAEVFASLRATVGYGSLVKSGRQVHLRTGVAQCLTEFREAFYPTGTKVLPLTILAELGPLGFAVWCMDDGCVSFDQHGSMRFVLSTDEFAGKEQQDQIASHLLTAFGVRARVQTVKGRAGFGLRLHFTISESVKVLRLIAPYVVAPFRDKWRLDDPETYRGPRSHAEVLRKANATRTARIRAGTLRVGYHTGTVRVLD